MLFINNLLYPSRLFALNLLSNINYKNMELVGAPYTIFFIAKEWVTKVVVILLYLHALFPSYPQVRHRSQIYLLYLNG